eukprot:19050-Heterococcus_DN1.PRE.1
MEYFKKFLKEVLRLVPPVSKFYRLVIEDFTVDGYTIPEGYTYAYNIAAAARNECDSPEECHPERYDDPQCPLNKPYGFAPFVGGEMNMLVHACTRAYTSSIHAIQHCSNIALLQHILYGCSTCVVPPL